MYNLFVTADDGRWDRSYVVYRRERVFEYTNSRLIQKYKSFERSVRNELMSFPSLFAYENSNRLDARIGWINHISGTSGSIQIEFDIDISYPPISFESLNRISSALDFGELEMSRTHWAVKNVNLFNVLFEAGLISERKPQDFFVFLCYASEDKDKVKKLYDYLLSYGIKAWFDKKDILPGQNWETQIHNAIRESHAVIVCLSNKSVTKEGFVQKELKTAIDIAKEKPEGTIFIIPARLEDCEVPQSLIEYQWVDLFLEEGYEKLINSLKKRADDLKIRIRKPYLP